MISIMSNCVVIQTKKEIILASDTASSVKINDIFYRHSDEEEKIHLINGLLLFCSGDMNICQIIVEKLKFERVSDVNTVAETAKRIFYDSGTQDEYGVEILIGKRDTEATTIYQISSYDDFKLQEYNMNQNGVAIYTAGIKTKKSYTIVSNLIRRGVDVKSALRLMYNDISDETVGGNVQAFLLNDKGISQIINEKINEDVKRFPADLRKFLVVAERLTGRILAGENLTIDASDNNKVKTFTVDGNGVWIKGNSLFITDDKDQNLINRWNKSIVQGDVYNGVKIDTTEGLTTMSSDGKIKTILNSTEGLSISTYKGTDWVKNFFVNTNGNLEAKDLTVDKIIIRNGDKVLVDGTTGTINYDNFTVQNGKIPASNIDLDVSKIGVTDDMITGTISGWKLNLSENLKGTTVTDVDGNATFIIDTEGKVSIPSQSSGTSFSNATFTGLTTVNNTLTVKDTLTAETDLVVGNDLSVGGLLDLSDAVVKWNQNTKGINVVVPAYAGSVDITGLTLSNANYGVNISPHWRTSFWVENKTETGFTVNFSIPSEVPVTFDWFLF